MNCQKNKAVSSPLFQAGFTLVEIAIVLVIIGLLLGGVLKGQAMVRQGKIKKLDQQVQEIRTAVNAYYRSVGRLPGDANNDGWIDLGGGTSEQNQVFPDLVKLNLISGNTTDTTRPHPFGGTLKVQYKGTVEGTFTYKNNCVAIGGINAASTKDADIFQYFDRKYDNDAKASGAIQYTDADTTLYVPL